MIGKIKPGSRVRTPKGKKVHQVKEILWGIKTIVCFCGEWAAGFPSRDYFLTTIDPVSCKKCLEGRRKRNNAKKRKT